MKIAIIIRRLNVKGGTQRQALCLARDLKKHGHQVKIYTFLYSRDNCYEDLVSDAEVISLGYYPFHSLSPFSLIYENQTARKLAFLIDKETEILNPHDQVSYRVATYFKNKIKNIPSVWMMNDMPTKSWSFWRDSQFNPDLRAPIIKKLFYWLVDFYEIHKFIKKQDKIIVLDNRDRQWVKQYFNKEAQVIRSGVDLEKFPYKQKNPLKNKQVKVLMTGIFFLHRRFEDGIQALKILTDQNYDATLSIVGDYKINQKYFGKLKSLVRALGLDERVYFLGKLSEEELLKQYQKNDIFVFPSHLQSWGLAVFEAMACGLPVIVSKTSGAAEVLNNRDNALLVNPKQPKEIAEAIKMLIDNPELYLKVSKKGREFVKNNISWSRYTEEMLKVFTQALKDK